MCKIIICNVCDKRAFVECDYAGIPKERSGIVDRVFGEGSSNIEKCQQSITIYCACPDCTKRKIESLNK